MTSTTPNDGLTPERRESARQAMEVIQREHGYLQQARTAFEKTWNRASQEAGVNADLLYYNGSPSFLAAEITEFISVENNALGGISYREYDERALAYVEISRNSAIERTGIDPTVLEDAELALKLAFYAARPHWEDARSARSEADRLAEQSVRSPARFEVPTEEMVVRLEARMGRLDESARQAFNDTWWMAADSGLLDRSEVRYSGGPFGLTAHIGDRVAISHTPGETTEPFSYALVDERVDGDLVQQTSRQIDPDTAAREAGMSIQYLLAQIEPKVQNALQAARPAYDEARALGERIQELLDVEEAAALSTDLEVEDEAPEWEVTPEQMQGKWVETVSTVRAHMEHGNYAAVRSLVRDADIYLEEHATTGVVMSDAEGDGVFLDAVTRAALPVGEPRVEEVVEQLQRLGVKKPDLPSPAEFAAITGVYALSESDLQTALSVPGKMPMPRTAESVAFVKEFRATTAENTVSLLASYNVPGAPGQALVERLDGSPHSYVSAMRTGAYSVVLNDVLGNQIEPEEVPERLGIEPAEAQRVIRGLENGLEAAEKELHPEEPQTGGVKQMSTAELDRIPVADSPEDVTNPSSANPLDSGWHPQPSDAAAGGPGW
ncbi:hypothetical protein [Brachybacterium tyrofermentans]|uniref:hypothetical protein n=1 Tax=Brachybacterium tyrofermentans TaxID=47848 RepID=UPI003FD2B60D